MIRINTLTKISFSLATTTVSVLVLAHALGIVPDFKQLHDAESKSRQALVETTAVQLSVSAKKGDWAAIQTLLESLSRQNPEILDISLKNQQGKVLAKTHRGNSISATAASDSAGAATDTLIVPIYCNRLPWGEAKFIFHPREQTVGLSWLGTSVLPLAILLGGVCFLMCMLYLRRVLTHLDPKAVIPERVRLAFDTLAEGLIMVDANGRVVLVNQAFLRGLGCKEADLFGRKLSDLLWVHDHLRNAQDYPWNKAIREAISQKNVILRIADHKQKLRSFSVNSVPVCDSNRKCRGAMVTFDDLTDLEEKNGKLNELLDALEHSNREIQNQNQELQYLATRDPLTGCLNRRAFFSKVEEVWKPALLQGQGIACIMSDIDHFKTFNDTHGHSVGDFVLKHVAQVLRDGLSKDALLCRYGGEEFCIVLTNISHEQTGRLAEELRSTIEAKPLNNLRISSSFGVAFGDPTQPEFAHALEQADKALYGSKRRGRNRVTTWPELVACGETEMQEENPAQKHQPNISARSLSVSRAAVQSMFQALVNRDSATAAHSRRVARLCLAIGQQLLTDPELEILEAAALLHDIGKLSVPDPILNKPGPLTPEEWVIMGAHDEIGSDLVELAFACPELCDIIRTHHAWYQGNPRNPNLPTAKDIPLGARILSIADAYDAIVSDRVYRKGRSHEEALVELKKCAGVQFDPELVERFSGLFETLAKQDSSSARVAPAALGLVVPEKQSLATPLGEDRVLLEIQDLVEDMSDLLQNQQAAPLQNANPT